VFCCDLWNDFHKNVQTSEEETNKDVGDESVHVLLGLSLYIYCLYLDITTKTAHASSIKILLLIASRWKLASVLQGYISHCDIRKEFEQI
jgi:hypothetical protein